MSYGLDMILSTEGSELRQSMSQLGVNMQYQWVSVAAGDVHPSFSRFSLDGINVRGGLVELTPGPFLFAVTAGQTQRAVQPSQGDLFSQPAFSRILYGIKIGYGNLAESFIHLIGVVARDNPSSLPDTVSLTPVENASFSPVFGIKLLENRLSVDGTVTVSSFTDNVRAPEGGGSEIPFMLKPFMTERTSTRTDYAGRINVHFTEGAYSIQTSYERVQPGFVSLGLSTTRSDQEQFSIRPQITFWQRRARVAVDYSQSRNNLLKNLSSTGTRRQIGLNAMTRVSDSFTVNGSYRMLLYSLDPAPGSPTVAMKQVSQNITLSPTLAWQEGIRSHTASVTAMYQIFDSERAGSAGSGYTNFSGTVLYTLAFESGLSLNSTVHILSGSAETTENSSLGLQLGAAYPFLERTLTVGVNGGFTHNTSSVTAPGNSSETTNDQLSLIINAAYKLWFGDTIRFSVRGLSSSISSGQSFSELSATLELSHQF